MRMVATWKIPRGTEHKQRGTEQNQIRGNKPRCNDSPVVGFLVVSTSELVTCTGDAFSPPRTNGMGR